MALWKSCIEMNGVLLLLMAQFCMTENCQA